MGKLLKFRTPPSPKPEPMMPPNRIGSWGKIEETQADRLEIKEILAKMEASTRYMQGWLNEHA
jgi:hypothetical protein